MKICIVCQEKLNKNSRSKYCDDHRPKHGYRKDRRCETCDKPILDDNLTGYCNKHRDRTGENNPMSKGSVFDYWISKYGYENALKKKQEQSEKLSRASTENWQKEEYRNNVIKGATGLKRSAEFRLKQSINTTKQMKDPKQLQIRSESMHKSYLTGALDVDVIVNNPYGKRGFTEEGIFYASKVELNRINFLNSIGYNWKRYRVDDFEFRIIYQFDDKRCLYIPDFLITIGDRTILEEMKCDLNSLSERELIKAEAARKILSEYNIEYSLLDNHTHTY